MNQENLKAGMAGYFTENSLEGPVKCQIVWAGKQKLVVKLEDGRHGEIDRSDFRLNQVESVGYGGFA